MAYNKSKAKGTRAENSAKEILIKHTGLPWLRTPLSGALGPEHKMKADLYIPECKNMYTIEVKHYADDHLTSKILTGTNPQLLQWWEQCIRQASQMNSKPLLIFKFDRSKMFVASREKPTLTQYIAICMKENMNILYICLLEDWLKNEQPSFKELI